MGTSAILALEIGQDRSWYHGSRGSLESDWPAETRFPEEIVDTMLDLGGFLSSQDFLIQIATFFTNLLTQLFQATVLG